MKCKFQLVDF